MRFPPTRGHHQIPAGRGGKGNRVVKQRECKLTVLLPGLCHNFLNIIYQCAAMHVSTPHLVSLEPRLAAFPLLHDHNFLWTHISTRVATRSRKTNWQAVPASSG